MVEVCKLCGYLHAELGKGCPVAVTPGSAELLACAFCDEQNAVFSCAEEKDERRYVQMLLECNCGVRMSEALSFNLYAKMSAQHIDANLRSKLTKRWNTRLAAKPADPDAMNEKRAAEDAKLASNVREATIEECAKILDACAQDWNRIRDPGMANNARAYARKIRALSTTGAPKP